MSSPPTRLNRNPLAFLGLRRVGDEGDEDDGPGATSPARAGGIELNRRGLPARKRKRNSLIYGADDVVSIPVKSPKRKAAGNGSATGKKSDEEEDSATASPKKGSRTLVFSPDKRRAIRALPGLSPAKKSPIKRPSKPTTPTKPSSKKKLHLPDEPPKKIGDDLELSSPEKKAAQSLGVALRNLLKLPKAHKWVCYEFFYSNIDRVLFEGENDFMVCLRESFPQLKTRRLTRVEWCKIRRLMGKPRRCSNNFFAEERAELAKKRTKIRMLQQRKQGDVANFKDLPEDIPLQLTIGTRVTARLRKPQDGLFTGTVDAYDTSNNTYRVTFDRIGLGTHSIPDHEVLSSEEPEMMPLSTFTQARVRPRPQQLQQQNAANSASSTSNTPTFLSPVKFGTPGYSPQLANDPLLSGRTPRGKVMSIDGRLGCYPIKFLDQIVRLSKCLKVKRELVDTLRDLNGQCERRKSFGHYINEDFQRKYAATVLDLSQTNRDLNEYLKNIREYTQEFSSEAGPTISLPNIIREGCQEDAYDLVNKSNTSGEKECVENPKILALISSLTALMMQLKQLADGGRSAFELQALQESIAEIKQNIASQNVAKFENCVEVHMQHIQSGLSQMGNLHAFMRPLQQIKSEPR